ncbi:hypothetical protein IWQ47_002088 [Aquimarina sp. EL_43]|uniref:hypothetical protein n=1 Tax=unclassified Aquimarina TaxID=2627091 RepID=UPI0018C9FE1E|nr:MULTISPECIES: hypothetical protein [unclassified Aquimarina]MBG6130612.1 hypothetical protein [Aquimarina sp. EL_35]MBG6151242.1 hypothetical protein [Aquimarina sp. EL_32]MBG6169014.1 hypothetical protein [Aquimarina sp. EL_43]
MKEFKVIALIAYCCFHFSGYAQNETSNKCRDRILEYLDGMQEVISPKKGQVYYMKYSTNTTFFKKHNLPVSSTKSEMLISEYKIFMDDENMKIYGDDKEMFVVLPKIGKIYWNDSDPRLFTDNNAQQKFLEIERTLLKSIGTIDCVTNGNKQKITIVPNKDFEKKSGLIRQVLEYDVNQKRVTKVENRFNEKSKIKKQMVHYEIIDYKSSKKIKKPLEYIFNGTELKGVYKNFEIIDNRKNK